METHFEHIVVITRQYLKKIIKNHNSALLVLIEPQIRCFCFHLMCCIGYDELFSIRSQIIKLYGHRSFT